MQHNNVQVLPIEKIISILSYLTMGIIGLIWLIISYFLKKRLRFFLMYNITQSMIISIFLAIFKLILSILLSIIAVIPFIDILAAVINFIVSIKVMTVAFLNISFSIFEIFLYLLIIYIIIGILFGRIFYIPLLTDFMNKVMKSYK